MKRMAFIGAVALSMAACGGGGSSSSSGGGNEPAANTDAAAGFWVGTTNTGLSVAGVVLTDTRYYFPYFTAEGALGGVIAGNGNASADSFTSSNALDYQFDGGIVPGDISASLVEKQLLSGTATYSDDSGTVEFSTGYDDYWETTPELAAITGTWNGWAETFVGGEGATVTIAGTGSVSAVGAGGCSFSGTVAPRTDGNVYNMQITAANSDLCAPEYKGKTLKGVVILVEGEIVVMGTVTQNRRHGVFFSGMPAT